MITQSTRLWRGMKYRNWTGTGQSRYYGMLGTLGMKISDHLQLLRLFLGRKAWIRRSRFPNECITNTHSKYIWNPRQLLRIYKLGRYEIITKMLLDGKITHTEYRMLYDMIDGGGMLRKLNYKRGS